MEYTKKADKSAVPLDEIVICPFCDGRGVVDSGGTAPWGTPIDIDCGCCEGKGKTTLKVLKDMGCQEI